MSFITFEMDGSGILFFDMESELGFREKKIVENFYKVEMMKDRDYDVVKFISHNGRFEISKQEKATTWKVVG